MLSTTSSFTRRWIVRVMVASALILVPLAIGTTPAFSHSSDGDDSADVVFGDGVWSGDDDDEGCDCTGRRGRGHWHGKGHHSHGKGHGYGHDKGHGCGGDDPAPVPSATFSFSPAGPVAGREVAFDASASTGGVDGDVTGTIETWSWDFGDGATGSGATAAHSYAAAGEYTVSLTVTNDYGESASTSQTVVVIAAPAPTASFVYTPPAPVAGTAVQLDAGASTGGVSGDYSGSIVSYEWQFPDGTTASGVTTTRSFAAGDHAVTLTVTNDFGASDSITQTVHVVPPPPPYNPGGGGGGAPQTSSLTVEPSSLSVSTTSSSGGKLSVKSSIGFEVPESADPAEACVGRVAVAGKARGAGSLRGRASLRARDGRCVAEFRHTLPASAAGKRIKAVYSFGGSDTVAAWRAQRTLKIRASR